jgi:group II intron reverse transcriptase/maturase
MPVHFWRGRLKRAKPEKGAGPGPAAGPATSTGPANGRRPPEQKGGRGKAKGAGRGSHRGRRRQHPAFGADALRRAWRQVRASGGGPGVDGVSIRAFETNLEAELADLGRELDRGIYRPRGVRRVFVPKPKEGLRPLAVWALRDRVAQRAVYNYLEPVFEPQFLDCSYGFRPGRSVQMAVAEVLAARDEGLRWVLDTDVKDCFDSIRPDLLMGMVRQQVRDKKLLCLLEAWLQARILNVQGQMQTAGTAQGGVLSPLLCNVYLHPFDRAVTGQGLRLVRYADDLVVLCRRRQEVLAAEEAVRRALTPLHLELNRHKTQVVHFDQGFKFLGVFFLRSEHFWL